MNMIFNIVVEKASRRVVEYGNADVSRFFTGENEGLYELHRGEVPQEFSRRLGCAGWDGEKVVDVGPREGFTVDGLPITPADTEPSVDEKIQAALEQQRQEFMEMLLKSGIKIS